MTIEQEMPQAVGSEKFVLSSFMRDQSLMEENKLNPEIFYTQANQIIYQELVKFKMFDLSLFVQKLHDQGLLTRVGGASALADIYTYAMGSTFKEHLKELRDKYTRRLAIKAATAAASRAYDTSDEDYLQALAEPITSVFDEASGATAVKDMNHLADDFLESFRRKLEGVELPMGIPFGIPLVDECLRGMQPQHYGIISGRSGSGKSTLAVEVLGHLAKQKVGALYLILERTESSAFVKAVIQMANVNYEAVVDPREYARSQGRENPNKKDLTAIKEAITTLVEANVHIRKPDNRSLATVMAEIRRYVRLHDVKVVFLDQIGLVRGERLKGETNEAELRRTSNLLQELSDELRITIVVLCQENADGDTKNARAIEEDADWWLSIQQDRDRHSSTFGKHKGIVIAKDSHNGNAGKVLPLVLDMNTLHFVYGRP